MIMKTNIQSMIKGVLMTVLSVFILSSCDDFLNQEPLSAIRLRSISRPRTS